MPGVHTSVAAALPLLPTVLMPEHMEHQPTTLECIIT